jgi:hypothetical protein
MDAYRAELDSFDPDIAHAIAGEERRQLDGVEMIPSENYTYPEVLAALGSVLTNKYSEGYPGRRYYGGQQYTDAVENIARDRACALFRAEHANVQPLSGSPMNQACCFAFLNPGDTVLAMDRSAFAPRTLATPYCGRSRPRSWTPQLGGAPAFIVREWQRSTQRQALIEARPPSISKGGDRQGRLPWFALRPTFAPDRLERRGWSAESVSAAKGEPQRTIFVL